MKKSYTKNENRYLLFCVLPVPLLFNSDILSLNNII